MKYDQKGAMSGVAIGLIFSIFLLVVALGFGGWAYSERQHYKNNSDQEVEKAVAVAIERTKTEKDNEFVEKEKEPYKTYRGPAEIGSVVFAYPKTWSGNVDIKQNEANFTFHPNLTNSDRKYVHALRVEVVNRKYEEIVRQFDTRIRQGKAKAKVFKLPKMPTITGVRIDGQYEEGKQGSILVYPIRDKTLMISSEDIDFVKDLDKVIIPSFSFSP